MIFIDTDLIYGRMRLLFTVYGQSVPVDHGEALYAALCQAQPRLHELDNLSISPILQADAIGNKLFLGRKSHFCVQVSQPDIPMVVGLAGRTYRIRNDSIRLGPPSVNMLYPAKNLHSRFVTTKNTDTEEAMREKLLDYLRLHESAGEVQVRRRRVMTIHYKKIVGFGVVLSQLEDNVSLRIQREGLFGRRRYTAGVFLPVGEAE